MSKVIKIKQSQIDSIVNQLVNEHMGEYQPTMADAQIEEAPIADNSEQYGIAVGPDGRHYVMNIKTGEVLGVK